MQPHLWEVPSVPAMSMDKEQTSSRKVRKKLRTSWSPETETTTEIVPTDRSTLMAETWSGSAFTCASEEGSGSGTSVDLLSRQACDGSKGAPGSEATAEISPQTTETLSGSSVMCASNGTPGSDSTDEEQLNRQVASAQAAKHHAKPPYPGPWECSEQAATYCPIWWAKYPRSTVEEELSRMVPETHCALSSRVSNYCCNEVPGTEATAEARAGPVLAAHDPPRLWTCEDCGNTFAVVSMLAYLKRNNEAAVLPSNKKLVEQTMQVQHGYSATLEKYSVTDNARLVCVYCCEKYHNTTYLSPAGKPTSAFAAMRKRSSGCHKQCPSAVKWMLNLHDKKIQHDTGYKPEIASKDIYNTLETWDSLGKDVFADTLCDGLLSVKYGCRPCLHYPLSSTGFYRCVSSTHPAETGISKTDWFWVCANCGETNVWGEDGAYRLLTIGSTESIAEGKYLCAYVQEKVSRSNENLMNFMKTCSLRSHIDGKPLSHWMILQAISEMNSAQDKRMCAGEVVTFTAKPIPKGYWQLHCENEELSTGCENKYKAIDVSLVDQGIPILSDELLTKNLDFAAAALNIDMNAHVTPAMTISRTALMARDSYQKACHRLRAICNHVMPDVPAPILQVRKKTQTAKRWRRYFAQ